MWVIASVCSSIEITIPLLILLLLTAHADTAVPKPPKEPQLSEVNDLNICNVQNPITCGLVAT